MLGKLEMYRLSIHATVANWREPTRSWNVTLLHVDTFVFPKDKANKTVISCILRGEKPQPTGKTWLFLFFNVESHGKLLSLKWSVSRFFFQWKGGEKLLFLLSRFQVFSKKSIKIKILDFPLSGCLATLPVSFFFFWLCPVGFLRD